MGVCALGQLGRPDEGTDGIAASLTLLAMTAGVMTAEGGRCCGERVGAMGRPDEWADGIAASLTLLAMTAGVMTGGG